MHPSLLMRDSPGRVKGPSASLSVEVIEHNILQISLLRLLLTLLGCRERLWDYHTIRKNVGKKRVDRFKRMKFTNWSMKLCIGFSALSFYSFSRYQKFDFPQLPQSSSAASFFQDTCLTSLLHCYSESWNVCVCCEYIHTWPAFDPCLYHTITTCFGSPFVPQRRLFIPVSPPQFYSLSDREEKMSSLDIPWGDVSQLKQWGGGGASGSLLEACRH